MKDRPSILRTRIDERRTLSALDSSTRFAIASANPPRGYNPRAVADNGPPVGAAGALEEGKASNRTRRGEKEKHHGEQA